MKLSFANDRVLAVMAHPDDAELLCAGTLARAKADGATVGVVVMCRGDKGAGSADTAGDALARLRQQETVAAAQLLGAELIWFGDSDGELMDSYENRRKLIEFYRQFNPTLVIAHAPGDYHADHRAASALAEAASWFCASRGHATESPAMCSASKIWFADTVGMLGFDPHFFLDVTMHVQIKKNMLDCHRSQLERGNDGDFAPLGALMRQQYQTRGLQCGAEAAEAFRWHHAFKRAGAF